MDGDMGRGMCRTTRGLHTSGIAITSLNHGHKRTTQRAAAADASTESVSLSPAPLHWFESLQPGVVVLGLSAFPPSSCAGSLHTRRAWPSGLFSLRWALLSFAAATSRSWRRTRCLLLESVVGIVASFVEARGTDTGASMVNEERRITTVVMLTLRHCVSGFGMHVKRWRSNAASLKGSVLISSASCCRRVGASTCILVCLRQTQQMRVSNTGTMWVHFGRSRGGFPHQSRPETRWNTLQVAQRLVMMGVAGRQ